MKNILITLFIAALGTVAGPAFAQTAAPAEPRADALYVALGQQAGLTTLVNDFVVRLQKDARTGPFFKSADLQNLKKQLADQFCVVSGGPCVYKGADMKSVHANLDITKADFNALVEVLQGAMDAQGIAFTTQNQLLARLAPMHRAVITVQ